MIKLLLLSLLAAGAHAGPVDNIRKTLGDLVAANLTNPPGNEAKAAAIGAARLQAAGIPYEVLEFAPGRSNLLAVMKGSGEKPAVLLLAHTDVVGTANQAWTSDPFKMTEKDGFLIGRGVLDDLGMAAVALEVFIGLKGRALDRDVILAWTGDEESGGEGLQDLLRKRPSVGHAGVALNEGGGLILGEGGKHARLDLQTAEKIYQDFELTAAGTTGHSSVPLEDNAIYKLSAALGRIAKSPFPERLIPVTKAYLAATKADRKKPSIQAILRTTCVATMLSGGTRVNALPAEAKANVNCRILPDETVEAVRKRLQKLAGPDVRVALVGDLGASGASPVDGEAAKIISKTAKKLWPNLLIVPTMSTGATDSRFLRALGMAAYGVNPVAVSEEDKRRAHGIDEKIPASSLSSGYEFFNLLVRELTGNGS
jgi:acetylornithine deacetylase/succinyl-diaminopimelate desuccinylase-like protein